MDTERVTHDGVLETARSASDAGEEYAAYSYEYGADLEIDAIELRSGGDTVRTEIQRDGDRLPTQVGPFTLTRDGPVGRVSRIADDDLQLDTGYDGRGRVESRTMTVAGVDAYSQVLEWDDSNRITAKTETVDGAEHRYEYTYEPDGQLDTVEQDNDRIEDHSWDLDGNRTTGGAVYGDDDVLDRTTATDYTFDAAGFLSARGSDTFAYSTAGELLQATVGGVTVSYGYDTLGRRVSRTQGGQTTRYLYGSPAAPYQVTGVRAPGGELTTLTYGRGDSLFALQRGNQRFYVGADQVGTPKVVTNASGTVVKTLAYDSFGKRTPAQEEGAAFELPIGFAGGLADPATGLVRFGWRDYDPATGRWTAKDPIRFDGSPDNLYAYVGSDPVGNRDASGLQDAAFKKFQKMDNNPKRSMKEYKKLQKEVAGEKSQESTWNLGEKVKNLWKACGKALGGGDSSDSPPNDRPTPSNPPLQEFPNS